MSLSVTLAGSLVFDGHHPDKAAITIKISARTVSLIPLGQGPVHVLGLHLRFDGRFSPSVKRPVHVYTLIRWRPAVIGISSVG